ncbi:MAG: hypothetical protein J7M19_01245 [Planctomycetes bacterium]|nr:hypothetical protein [Planctomycetota bacterium]
MTAKKGPGKSKTAKTDLAGKCLSLLRRNVGARNITSSQGGLTSVLLLAIIARGSSVAEGRKILADIRESFVDWNELRVTRPAQITVHLGSIKQANGKARTICDVLGNIFEGTHNLELGFLEGASAEEARDFLTGLGGLSKEMVDEVILSGRAYFHMEADTDVARVARRLGLAGRYTSPGGFQRDIDSLLGEERGYQLMFLFKELSEAVCTMRGQHCTLCPLSELCPAARTEESA